MFTYKVYNFPVTVYPGLDENMLRRKIWDTEENIVDVEFPITNSLLSLDNKFSTTLKYSKSHYTGLLRYTFLAENISSTPKIDINENGFASLKIEYEKTPLGHLIGHIFILFYSSLSNDKKFELVITNYLHKKPYYKRIIIKDFTYDNLNSPYYLSYLYSNNIQVVDTIVDKEITYKNLNLLGENDENCSA